MILEVALPLDTEGVTLGLHVSSAGHSPQGAPYLLKLYLSKTYIFLSLSCSKVSGAPDCSDGLHSLPSPFEPKLRGSAPGQTSTGFPRLCLADYWGHSGCTAADWGHGGCTAMPDRQRARGHALLVPSGSQVPSFPCALLCVLGTGLPQASLPRPLVCVAGRTTLEDTSPAWLRAQGPDSAETFCSGLSTVTRPPVPAELHLTLHPRLFQTWELRWRSKLAAAPAW